MTAESQYPYELYTQRELLRRPLEPHIATAIDPPNSPEIDDALHAQFGEDSRGQFADITTYIADAAILGAFPKLIEGARQLGFSRYNGDKSELMLPKFALEQLGLDAPNEHGIPAIAVRMRAYKRSTTLTDIERVRLRVNTTTYSEFAKGYRNHDATYETLGECTRFIFGRRKYEADFDTQEGAQRMVSQYMRMTSRLVARTMRHTELPWVFRYHHNTPAGHQSTDSRWAEYSVQPLRHDALKMREYCHVTSPLRRFPDLANHLNFVAMIEHRPLPYSKDDLITLAGNVNAQMHHYGHDALNAA